MPFCTCRPSFASPTSSNLSLVRTNTISHQPDWDGTEYKTEVFEFHDPRRLITLANDGRCVVSLVLVNALDAVKEEWADEATWIVVRKPLGQPHEIIVLGGSLDLNIRLFVPHDVPPVHGFSRLQSATMTELMAEDSTNDSSCKLVRSWLDRCLKNHASTCGRPMPKQQMPKRLIDTQRKSPSNHDVRLEETNGKIRKYIALSHCWGGEQPIKLCKRTFASMKKRIPWTTIPKNLQDAITFARDLEIRWIWIDTLCIIQDEVADWQRESAKMANIYEGAHLTIVAANSSNCNESFLRPRRSGAPVPKLSGQVWVRKKHDHENLETAPLFSRGWAYQERLLSTRMVIFGNEELYWECKTDQLCECGSQDGKMQARPLKRQWKPGESYHWQSVERHDYWHECIAAFTSCKLTFCKDKLPALSGIASRSKSHSDDIYLAGLWKDRLIRDLCWQQNDDSKRTLPTVYRAPTWSWASIDAQIINQFEIGCDREFKVAAAPNIKRVAALRRDDEEFRVPAIPPAMRIVDASCTPLGENPYGEVKDGYIIVSAPTITVKLEAESKPPPKGTENGFSVVISGSSNASSNYFWPDAHLRCSSSVVRENTVLRCDEEIKPAWKNLDAPVKCVLVMQGESFTEGVNMKTASRCIWALVLGKARGESEVWERLGILTSFRKSGAEAWGGGFKWFEGAPVETVKII